MASNFFLFQAGKRRWSHQYQLKILDPNWAVLSRVANNLDAVANNLGTLAIPLVDSFKKYIQSYESIVHKQLVPTRSRIWLSCTYNTIAIVFY